LLQFGQEFLTFIFLSTIVKTQLHKIIHFPVVLYGRETSSLTLREKYRVTVSENSVLRNMFGLKRNEVAGNWRKFHNEQLRDLYSTRSIIPVIKSRRMRWGRHEVHMGPERGIYWFCTET
jgi:hypothetical protein